MNKTVQFIDDDHKRRFAKYAERFGIDKVTHDRQYKLLAYTLAAFQEESHKAQDYASRDGFDWTAMFNGQDFSSGNMRFMQAAQELFGWEAVDGFNLSNVPALQSEYFTVVIDAMMIARGAEIEQ